VRAKGGEMRQKGGSTIMRPSRERDVRTEEPKGEEGIPVDVLPVFEGGGVGVE
jgi:hypothetical protein